MRILQTFDPSLATSGKITTQTVNPCSVVVLFNHSLYGMTLTLPGGNTANLPPWYFRYYYLPIPGNIDWKQNFALTSTGPPSSVVTGEVYEPSEAENRTFMEGPLPLQTNVGNTVNTNAGGSNSVQNDANTVQTFIEATLSGSPGSNIIVKNDGTIQSLEWIAGILTQIFKTDPGAASVVKLGNTGLLTEALGSLTVDQVLTAIGNTSLATLSTSGLATLNSLAVTNAATMSGVITSANNQPHQWKDSGGTARKVLTVDGSNNVQLFGITGLDFIQLLSSGGVVKMLFDLINGLINISGVKQTITGNTSGTMDVYEIFAGALKLVVFVQTNYRDTNAFANVTLKTAFSTVGCILNFGCGGILTGTANVADVDQRQITWGTGTSAGTQAACTGIPQNAAGFTTHGFTQVGSNNYATAHGGGGFIIGI